MKFFYQLYASSLNCSFSEGLTNQADNWTMDYIWNLRRRVWRYQRGNQNLYIEEEQTTQWPKEKVQKDFITEKLRKELESCSKWFVNKYLSLPIEKPECKFVEHKTKIQENIFFITKCNTYCLMSVITSTHSYVATVEVANNSSLTLTMFNRLLKRIFFPRHSGEVVGYSFERWPRMTILVMLGLIWAMWFQRKISRYEFWKNNKEELEDTKGLIRIRISKKNRQLNGQKKINKRTNNNIQDMHIKPKIE
jgi:hypothetical protein